MKLHFQLLLFCISIIGTFSFSSLEKPEQIVAQLHSQQIEKGDSEKEDSKDNEFRKEEEENEQEENEEEDLSEDLEIEEEEPSEYAPPFCYGNRCIGNIGFGSNCKFPPNVHRTQNALLQNYPPFYILFTALRVDC